MIGLFEYTGRQKESWRGWMWNRIIERLPDYKPGLKNGSLQRICRDKVVLYLPGPDDVDRPLAISKGFRNENLIAVDICQKRIAAVRKAGGVGIVGSLQEVLARWNRDDRLDVIFADLCGGLNKNAISLITQSQCSLRGIGVLAVNLLRGRDAESNNASRLPLLDQLTKEQRDYGGFDAAKHRGIQFAVQVIKKTCRLSSGSVVMSALSEYQRYVLVGNLLMPVFASYRSDDAKQTFDSVVMRVFGCSDWMTTGAKQEQLQMVPSRLKGNPKRLRGRMSAMRAVRTMKGNRR